MIRVPVRGGARWWPSTTRGSRASWPPSSRDAPIQHVHHGVPGHHGRGHATSPAEVRRRHGIPDDAVVFGSFGRVTPEKSLTRVLRPSLRSRRPLPAIRLLVVGDTPAYFDLDGEARALGLADRVTVTGYVDDGALPEYLSAPWMSA